MKINLTVEELHKIIYLVDKVDAESTVTDIVLERDGTGIGYTLDLYLTTRFLGDVVDVKYEVVGVKDW